MIALLLLMIVPFIDAYGVSVPAFCSPMIPLRKRTKNIRLFDQIPDDEGVALHRKPAYGRFRIMCTMKERRWADAWEDDEDFRVSVRRRRSAGHLPDSWDDIFSHNDKSWKTQSKRRRQWKPN